MRPLRANEVTAPITFAYRDILYPFTFDAPTKPEPGFPPSMQVILALLLANPNGIVPREVMYQRVIVWSTDCYIRVINTHVSRLRDLLQQIINPSICIQSVYGIGYYMTAEDVEICKSYILTQTRFNYGQ